MSDKAVEFKQKHVPYSDGSGYRYEIGVERRYDGQLDVVVDATGGLVSIAVEDWPTIRKSIDEAVEFVKSRATE